jgi:ABC-type transport system involved in multi-copper enzyme maturation permease subunit
MRPLLALVRKEFASLFGAPTAYVTLTMVALVAAIIFFERLKLYNQILILYATSTMGGFDTDTIPDHVNLWDTVFFPVMEALGVTLLAAIPIVTMRVFAEERARGTDELLVTTHLSPWQIVLAKFAVTYAFVALLLAASFVYPAAAIEQGGLGLEHLAAVFWDFGWSYSFVNEATANVLDQIALHPRYGTFSEGIVALENIAYFAALGLVCMAVARFSFDLRRVGA